MFTTRKKVHPYKKEIKSRIILNKEKRIILAMNEFQKLSDVKVNDLSKFPWWPARHAIFDTVLNCYKLKKQISRRKYEIKKGVEGENGYSIQKLFETKVTIGRRRKGRCASRSSPLAHFAGYKQPSLGATWGHFIPPSVSVKEDYFFKGFRKSKIPLKLINLFFKEMDNMVETFAGKNKKIIEPISLPESPLVSRIISFMKVNYLRSAHNLGSSLSDAKKGTEGFAPSFGRQQSSLLREANQPSLAARPTVMTRATVGVEEKTRKDQKKVARKIKKILNFFILYQTLQKIFASLGSAPEWDHEIGGKLIPITTFLIAKRIGEGISHSHNYRNKNIILISKKKIEMSNDEIIRAPASAKGVGEIETEAQIEPFPYNPNLRITKELLNQIIVLPPYKFEKLQEGEKISALYGDLEKSQSALAGGYPRTHRGLDERRQRQGYKMGVSLKITPDKIGYKLGEFLKTRKDPIIKIKKKN